MTWGVRAAQNVTQHADVAGETWGYVALLAALAVALLLIASWSMPRRTR